MNNSENPLLLFNSWSRVLNPKEDLETKFRRNRKLTFATNERMHICVQHAEIYNWTFFYRCPWHGIEPSIIFTKLPGMGKIEEIYFREK